jgi:hypothetical protein
VARRLDLHPLDVHDPADVAWLDALVWLGEEHLRAQLRAALDLTRAEPVTVRAGDLVADLPALLAEAPRDATLVGPWLARPARGPGRPAVSAQGSVAGRALGRSQ